MFQRIQKVIDDSHLSLPVFAKRLGVSRSAVISYKTGKTAPKTTFIERLCDEFAVNKKWLLFGEGAPYQETEKKGEKPSNAITRATISLTARILLEAGLKPTEQIESMEFWEKERRAYRFLVQTVFPGANWGEMSISVRSLIVQCLCPLFIDLTSDELQVVKKAIDRWVDSQKSGAKSD